MRHDFTHVSPDVPLNAARYAACTRVVWHEYQIAARQADIGGQGGSLVAALFLFYLYQNFTPFLEQVLDLAPTVIFFLDMAQIVGGDFLEGQKAVALGSVIDKSRLKAGFYPGDDALVDVGFFLFAGGNFYVKVI